MPEHGHPTSVFQDSLSRLFPAHLRWPFSRWAKMGEPREKPPGTPHKQNLACLTCGQCGARTHTRHSCEDIFFSPNRRISLCKLVHDFSTRIPVLVLFISLKMSLDTDNAYRKNSIKRPHSNKRPYPNLDTKTGRFICEF